jgi:hypothetical protein
MSSPPTPSASDSQIRSKLLNRLGIYNETPTSPSASQQPMTAAQHRRVRILKGMGVGYTLPFSPADGSAQRTPLDGMNTFQEPLKADTANKKTKINFQDEVEVMPIPTRYEYSDRIGSLIWSNQHELQENAERNTMEFAAEGWNWRNVTEDEGMYICSVSGELVHPIHLQHLVQEEAAPSPALERGAPVHSCHGPTSNPENGVE